MHRDNNAILDCSKLSKTASLDRQAELEGKALRKQGRARVDKRIIYSKGNIYNQDKFDRLFRKG